MNCIVKHFLRPRRSHDKGGLTQLLCGEGGLVPCLEQTFMLGFKFSRLFGRNLYLWDFFGECLTRPKLVILITICHYLCFSPCEGPIWNKPGRRVQLVVPGGGARSCFCGDATLLPPCWGNWDTGRESRQGGQTSTAHLSCSQVSGTNCKLSVGVSNFVEKIWIKTLKMRTSD